MDGKIPYHLFCRVEAEKPSLKHLHTFGCPAFVLNKALLNNVSKPDKLINRSKMGIYLGPSPNHASNVHMILSLQTGHVSPQFHVYFDNMFETIRERAGVPQSNWQNKMGIQNPITAQGVAKAHIPTEHSSTSVSAYVPAKHISPSDNPHGTATDPTTGTSEPQSARVQTSNDHTRCDTGPNSTAGNVENVADVQQEQADAETLGAAQQGVNDYHNHTGDHTGSSQETGSEERRWSRRHKPTARLREYMGTLQSMTCMKEALNQEDSTFLDGMDNPLCFMSPKSDTLYFDQAMQAEDREEFKEAMTREVNTHFERKHWESTAIQEVPTYIKLLDSVWAMRRKRRISTGEIYKYKARLNAHGGQQVHCIHYWDTYAPVVSWFAIRMMLTLVLLHKWSTLTMDFVLAYPQADVDSEIYMKLP